MKFSTAMSTSAGQALLGLILAAAGVHAQTDSVVEVKPSIWSHFAPVQIQVGPQIAVTGSRFTASPQYQALVTPTSAAQSQWVAPSYGLLASARWDHGISLTLAPRHETYGVSTREQTVSFANNPFPHTLTASTELSYTVWPVLLGMGWFTSRQQFQVQLGLYTANLEQANVAWTVDGEAYPNMPQVQVHDSQGGWIWGTEYGYHIGNGDLLLGVESERGFHSLMSGMQGSIKVQAARAHLTYAWTMWKR